jgi:hypothetical protein
VVEHLVAQFAGPRAGGGVQARMGGGIEVGIHGGSFRWSAL